MRLTPSTDLNGTWEMQPEKTALDAPKGNRWHPVPVPLPWSAFLFGASGVPDELLPGRMAWFRRKVRVPEIPPRSRLFLHFDAVNFLAMVFVNGKPCGEHVGDAIPFDIDITGFAEPNREAVILVGVQDPSAAEIQAEPAAGRAARRLRYPALAQHPGIWGDVSLQVVPELHIQDVTVSTTLFDPRKNGLQEGRIRVRVVVENGTARPVSFSLTSEVYDGARQAVAFAPVRGAVGAHERTEIDMGTTWDSAALWWPDQPHLYTLRTALWSTVPDAARGAALPGEVVDRVHTSIGFRDFRIDGSRFLLNGVPTQLRSESLCPISGLLFGESRGPVRPVEAEQAVEILSSLKRKKGLNAVRFHRIPPSPQLLDAADSVGLMAIVELPLPDDELRYAVDNPKFWLNAQELAERWVRTRAHHASIMMWSVDQGMVRRYGRRVTDGLQSLARFIADLDPTRPVENSGDADLVPTGELGISSPVSVFFPATGVAFRSAAPYEPESIRGRVLPGDLRPGPWLPVRPEDRPLCILEHGRRSFSPTSLAFFLGDRAYVPAVDLASAAASVAMLEMAACRIAGFAAVHTIGRPLGLPGGDAGSEVAALPKTLFGNFYAGTRFVEELVLRNDTRFDQDIELVSRFTTPDGKTAEHAEELLLPAGGQAERPVAFELPDIRKVYDADRAAPTVAEFSANLTGTRAGSFQHKRKVAIWPHVRSAGSRRIGLYDPEGHTASALSAVGAKYAAAHGALDTEFDTILIGENALDRGAGPDPEALRAFVARGGLAICLAQDDIPYDFSPVPLVLDESRAAAITFVRDGDHRILLGLSDAEMRWWQDDHLVATRCFRKPALGNFRCLVDAGGPGGLRWAAAIEVFHGRGSFLFCQMKLVERAARAPVAGLLLARLSDATPSWRPIQARTLEGETRFAPVGVACPALAKDFSDEDLASIQVVLLTSDSLRRLVATQVYALRGWVQRGGTIYLHSLRPDDGKYLAALSGEEVRLVDSPQERLVFQRPGCGLARGLSSADLYFVNHGARFRGEGPRRMYAANVVAAAHGNVTGIAATAGADPDFGLLTLHLGTGRIVIDQVRWDVETAADARPGRYISTLLTNLGVPLAPPSRTVPSGRCLMLDLAAACNSSLGDPLPGDGQGWTGRGPDNDLSSLAPGLLLADGVPFRVAGAGPNVPEGEERTCCVIGPDDAPVAAPIEINRRVESFAFLVACEGRIKRGRPIAHFTVKYEDGLETRVPLRYGLDVLDWNEWPHDLDNAAVAWKGATLLGEPAAIYAKLWPNTRSAVPVKSVTFSSTGSGPTPILLAITAIL